MQKIVQGIFLLSLLSGCGGGGSSSKDANPTQFNENQAPISSVGLVVDSQIIGLRYKSVSPTGYIKEGITNAKGEYEYFEGGTTGFYVGKIKIGDIESRKFVAITSTVSTEKESENIAVFLQTIDEDSNPDNGIEISSTVDQNAQRITDFKFDDTFEENIDDVKSELFKHAANIPATVSVANAISHSSKSERLSSLHEFDLYEAIANEKNYRSGDYYNADVLENDQRKRVYLWIWQKLIAKEMEIEDELQFSKPSFDLDNVEQTRNQVKKYLDYAEGVMSVASLGKGTHENLAKAGGRTMSYNFAKLTSLTVGGCDAVVKLYDADTGDTIELSDDDLCKNMMKIINPVGDSTSKLAIANPIMSGFLPELLPKLIHAQKMNWLHFNTKSLRTISKMKVSKPDVISIALSIAQIANDFGGAYWASTVNEELTTRMVAREWLNLWFRSGLNQAYMNKLINNNTETLTGTSNQVEAIALKLGATGALCDTYEFFNPFYECTGIENINYNHEKVISIINEKLSKSSAIYKNITALTGSISNEESEIGVIEIDWIEDAEVDVYVQNETIIFSDIEKSDWFAWRAKSKNTENWDAIDFDGSTITLKQDYTDNGPNLISVGITPIAGKKIKITRSLFLHPHRVHGDYEYFVGGINIFSSSNSEKLNNENMTNDNLCQVRYYNYEYQGDWDTFFLQDIDNESTYIPSIWDEYFEEVFIYDPETGAATYQVGNNKVRADCKPLKDNFIRINMHTYGWWTGHFTKISKFNAHWVD